MTASSESFLQRLKSVRLAAFNDRVRVSTPCDPATRAFQRQECDAHDEDYTDGIIRFHQRLQEERHLTMENNDGDWTAGEDWHTSH